MLLSVSRRLQRRMPQAPALIEPSVKALDEAIEALEGATRAVEEALEACDFDPQELERCEERLFALRAMSRKHARADREPAGAGAEIRRRSRRARSRAQRGRAPRGRVAPRRAAAYTASARALSAGARARAPATSRQAVTAELPPLKLERAEFRVELTTRRRRSRRRAATTGPSSSSGPIPARVRGR